MVLAACGMMWSWDSPMWCSGGKNEKCKECPWCEGKKQEKEINEDDWTPIYYNEL